MVRNFKDRIVVLKSKDYKEKDKLITVLSRERGKFVLLAKGIRRLESRNRGSLQTLSISDVSYYQAQGIPLLIESKSLLIPDFAEINIKNVERILVIVNKLMGEEQKHERVFNALCSAIEKNVTDESINRFRLLFLIEEGLVSNMESCDICGGNEDLKYLKLTNFVMICKSCYSSKKWSKSELLAVGKDTYQDNRMSRALDSYISNLLSELT